MRSLGMSCTDPLHFHPWRPAGCKHTGQYAWCNHMLLNTSFSSDTHHLQKGKMSDINYIAMECLPSSWYTNFIAKPSKLCFLRLMYSNPVALIGDPHISPYSLSTHHLSIWHVCAFPPRPPNTGPSSYRAHYLPALSSPASFWPPDSMTGQSHWLASLSFPLLHHPLLGWHTTLYYPGEQSWGHMFFGRP